MNKAILPTKNTYAVEEKRCEHRCLIGSMCKKMSPDVVLAINAVTNDHMCIVSKSYTFIILNSLIQKFGIGLFKNKALSGCVPL